MDQRLFSALTVFQWDTSKKVRLGNIHDGGYVVVDIDDEMPPYDCYISAGVSTDDCVSNAIITRYHIPSTDCFAFDGTVSSYPTNPPTDIIFIKKNVGPINTNNETNLHDLIEKYNKIFLKMDIEGGEYPWFKTLSIEQLQHFRQIVIEFHGCNDDSWGTSFQDKLNILTKLATTHYIVHSHANNFGGTRNYTYKQDNSTEVTCCIPNVIELTYVRKSDFTTPLQLNKTPLPISGLDIANNYHINDIDLSCQPFTFP